MRIRFYHLLLVVLLSAGMAACGGAEGRKQKYLDQADASFAKQDYEKARINYKNVLQIDPKDVKGREGYARTLERLKDWRGAVGQYRAIIEDDPNNNAAKVKLGQLYLLAKASDLAMTLAEEILAVEATNDAALALKAGAQSQMGKGAEALVNAEQAYKLNKSSLDNIILLASLYAGMKRPDDAIALLEAETANHPNSSSIYTMLNQIYLATQRTALAEGTMKKLIELNPAVVGYKSQLARFYEISGRKDEAESILKAAVASDPGSVDSVVALHRFYLQRNDQEKAERVLRDAIAVAPENFDLQLNLASYFLSQKNIDKARKIYTALLEKDDVTVLKAKTRLAYLSNLEGDVDAALATLEEVLKENSADVEALKLRGAINLARNKPVDAINDLRAVMSATPDAPDVMKMLGRAHLLNRENQQAIDLYKAALNLQPGDVELRLQLADVYAAIGEKNEAAKQLEASARIAPNNAVIMEKMVRVYIDSQYLDDAENVLKDLQKLDPHSPRNAYYQGVIYQGRNKHQAALAEFDKSMALKAGATEPMAAKVKSYIALKQIDEAIAWLASMEGSDQPNPVALNLQGEVHMAKKSWDKAKQYFQRCADVKPDWWIPYRNRAMVESVEKNADSAHQYLAGVVDAVDSAPLRIEMANYAERSGKYDSAIQQYEAVLAKGADNQVIANNLAMLIVTYKKDAESLNRAKQLADSLSASDNPSFLDTAGWVQSVAGDYQRALPMIQQALRAAPDDPAIQYHLAMTYLGASDKANAERYLERALESDKKFHGREEAEKILAQLKQQS